MSPWDDFVDPEEARAESLVFDPGNQFGTRKGDRGLFFAIPSWWRGFLFHVLTASEFMMYGYLCAQMSKRATAFPTGEHFKRDLRRSTNTTVYRLVNSLEHLGFVLKKQHAPLRKVLTQRNLYQRPAPEFTLLRLLELGLIDGDLLPVPQQKKATPKRKPRVKAIPDDDYSRRHGTAVQLGLQRLLTQGEYKVYQAAPSQQRASVLREVLQGSLNRRREEAKVIVAKKPGRKKKTR